MERINDNDRSTFGHRARSRLRIALLACAVAGTLALPLAGAVQGAPSSSVASERDLIALTNRSRAAAGLKALKVSSTLTSIARWRSADMLKRGYFSHAIPGYGDVFKRLDAKGYCYRLAGENIGWNTYPADLATAAIHRMFMDSHDHRANILSRRWDAIGVGMYQRADGKKMWTVLFADVCASAPKPTRHMAEAPRPKPRPTPRATPKPTVASRDAHADRVAKDVTQRSVPTEVPRRDRSAGIRPGCRCLDPRATIRPCPAVAGPSLARVGLMMRDAGPVWWATRFAPTT